MEIILFTYSLMHMRTLEIKENHGKIKGIYLQN